jgi:hypothetical protein
MWHLADTDALVRDGVLTPAQAAEIGRRARDLSITLGINLFLAIGVLAVILGTLALIAEAAAAALLGVAVAAAGFVLVAAAGPGFRLIANATAVTGAALAVAGSVWFLDDGLDRAGLAVPGGLAVAALGLLLWQRGGVRFRFAAGAILVLGAGAHVAGFLLGGGDDRFLWLVLSWAGLLAIACGTFLDVRLISAASVLPLAASLSARSFYSHASYGIAIYEVTLTILELGAIALVAFLAAPRLPERLARHARIVGLMMFLWINVAFWIGSLWGDVPGAFLWGPRWDEVADATRDWEANQAAWAAAEAAFLARTVEIAPEAFAVLWAVLLAGTLVWAAARLERPVFNAAAAFAVIHAYTQYFERIDLTPGAVVIAGIAAILAGWGLWRINGLFAARG